MKLEKKKEEIKNLPEKIKNCKNKLIINKLKPINDISSNYLPERNDDHSEQDQHYYKDDFEYFGSEL